MLRFSVFGKPSLDASSTTISDNDRPDQIRLGPDLAYFKITDSHSIKYDNIQNFMQNSAHVIDLINNS